jgi:hypothetical protein
MAAAASPELLREVQQQIGSLQVREAEQCTLLELVEAVSEVTHDDAEVVATVVHMLRVGSVCLTGNFHGEPISDFDDVAED